MFKSLSRFLSAALVVSMLGATMPAPVSARMIGSEETLSAAQVDADRATINAWLARAEVRDELVAMGVSPAEVEARVAALGDDEIRDLAGKVGTAPAGARIVGINNRNLQTFHVDLETTRRLAGRIPEGLIRVSESGISTIGDVESLGDIDAVLVGEALVTSRDPGQALALLSSARPAVPHGERPEQER